jgi:hypothetical protein
MSADPLSASDPAFVDAVARRVVEMLREEGELPLEGPRLVTVAQVRDEFGVSADWLHANAEALGAIRLGSGPRARLRFDRTTIAERIATLASDGRRTRSARGHRKRARAGEDGGLLPILDTPA